MISRQVVLLLALLPQMIQIVHAWWTSEWGSRIQDIAILFVCN